MTIFEGKKLNIFLNIRLVFNDIYNFKFKVLFRLSQEISHGNPANLALSNRMESNSKLVKIRLGSVRKKRQKLGFSESEPNRIQNPNPLKS